MERSSPLQVRPSTWLDNGQLPLGVRCSFDADDRLYLCQPGGAQAARLPAAARHGAFGDDRFPWARRLRRAAHALNPGSPHGGAGGSRPAALEIEVQELSGGGRLWLVV